MTIRRPSSTCRSRIFDVEGWVPHDRHAGDRVEWYGRGGVGDTDLDLAGGNVFELGLIAASAQVAHQAAVDLASGFDEKCCTQG